jgi:hypothetical protein
MIVTVTSPVETIDAPDGSTGRAGQILSDYKIHITKSSIIDDRGDVVDISIVISDTGYDILKLDPSYNVLK